MKEKFENPVFQIGDKVEFLRQAVGYPTVKLQGTIVEFNYTEDNSCKRYPVAHIMAKCEYGYKLPWNHTIHLTGLKKN